MRRTYNRGNLGGDSGPFMGLCLATNGRVKKVAIFSAILSLTTFIVGMFFISFEDHQTQAATPVVTNISPNSGPAAGGTNVTITGNWFANETLTYTQLAAGSYHECGIVSSGRAYCWGFNLYGQLGNASSTAFNIPVAVNNTIGPMAGKTIKQIDTGSTHTCAIASDNQAYCWGNNGYGQLGNGVTGGTYNVPTAIDTSGALSGKTIKQISTGDDHTCVVASDDNAYCWGYNLNGQLGNGTSGTASNANTPVAINNTGTLAGKTIKKMIAGSNYTCAIASDDQAYCWGSNSYGKLGNGVVGGSPSSPTAVITTGALLGKTVKQLAAGDSHACVVASDNNAYCWGYNSSGQLGNGTYDNSNIPVAVTTTGALAGKTIKQISAGGNHACAIASDNNLYCWGYNSSGQLGDGNNTATDAPVTIDATGALSGKTIMQVTAKSDHTCAIASDYNAYCWGNNTYGKLGNGTTGGSFNTPLAVNVTNLTTLLSVKIGGNACLNVVIVNSTTITCTTPAHAAGQVDVVVTNGDGQSTTLTNGYTYIKPEVTSITPNRGPAAGAANVTINGNWFAQQTAKFKQLTAGVAHTCAIASDNQAYCWGFNSFFGQLGNGTYDDSNIPVAVTTTGALAGKTIKQISAGGNHTCAIASDNQAYCWGYNGYGQLGSGNYDSVNTPVAVNQSGVLVGKTIMQIAAGSGYTCAIASDNQAYCWGDNSSGQLGDGTGISSNVPVAVSISGVLTGKTVKQITSGSYHVCAIASDNQAYCWGENTLGELGIGSTGASQKSPVAVDTSVLSGKIIKQITAGAAHTCAIASDNNAYCWGYNGFGELGRGNNTNSNVPVAVSISGVLAGKTIQQIMASGDHTCAIASDNQPYCWGDNGDGGLGSGNTTNSNVPVSVNTSGVLAGKSVAYITAGAAHTCAIASDNNAYCWGRNDNGQLGNAANTNSNVPVTVSTANMVRGVSVTLGGAPCNNVVLVSLTTITCTTPAHAAGPVNVVVINGDGQTATLINGYTYYDVPSAPLNLTASRGSLTGDLVLNWLAPTTDNYSTITDYVIQYKLSSDSTWTTWTHAASTSLTATVTGLTGGSSYDFRVAAINEAGTGPYSNTATLTASVLSIGIVDSSGATVTSPNVPFGTIAQSSDCVSSYGTLGSSSQQIRIANSTTNGNWDLSMAATSGPTAKWQRTTPTASYAYNDFLDSGCSNGQLSVSPAASSIVPSAGCSASGINKGVQTAFNSGVTDSITLLTATNQSIGNCYWDVRNFSLNQAIPAGQSPGNYQIDMTLTLVAL